MLAEDAIHDLSFISLKNENVVFTQLFLDFFWLICGSGCTSHIGECVQIIVR